MASVMQPQADAASTVLAAVDLGSNSFHMVVARFADGQLSVVDRLREMVRLAAGLDPKKRRLGKDAQERALACLERFGERIRYMRADQVRIVGTNTLRRAKNAHEFIAEAEKALGHPVEIVSGYEEARLVYLGVANTMPSTPGRRLVVDIGGGSTELIIGEGKVPDRLESISAGCVRLSQRFFQDGKITAKRMRRARVAARVELEPVEAAFRDVGWEASIGASGTIRAARDTLRGLNLITDEITPDALESLGERLVEARHVDRVRVPGLSSERAPVFPGGLAALLAVFDALQIKTMRVSKGALREGLLYDMVGRATREDARVRTVRSLEKRYRVDVDQASRVESLAQALFEQVQKEWQLPESTSLQILRWAARLHEMGLAISHARHHRHGAYLLEHSALAGFSQYEQHMLAVLVGAHRRRISSDTLTGFNRETGRRVGRLVVLLRLAVLLHRARGPDVPVPKINVGKHSVELTFANDWLDTHPLALADLKQEAEHLKAIGVTLSFG